MAMFPTRHSCDLCGMRRALNLATGVRGHVWPNPPVGCVIVKDGVVIAEAATHPGGRPHAERKALEQAGTEAKTATLYVTLEPCCHWGGTPPCADAIIEAGVSRVVCAIQDPDPRVNGGGFARLREAGVNVASGLCADAAKRLMSGFFHRVQTGAPEIVVMGHAPQDVPVGVDALILTLHDGLRLLTRAGEGSSSIDIGGVPRHRLLARLAEMGLTSVAVSRDDPVARCLSASRAQATLRSILTANKATLRANS